MRWNGHHARHDAFGIAKESALEVWGCGVSHGRENVHSQEKNACGAASTRTSGPGLDELGSHQRHDRRCQSTRQKSKSTSNTAGSDP